MLGCLSCGLSLPVAEPDPHYGHGYFYGQQGVGYGQQGAGYGQGVGYGYGNGPQWAREGIGGGGGAFTGHHGGGAFAGPGGGLSLPPPLFDGRFQQERYQQQQHQQQQQQQQHQQQLWPNQHGNYFRAPAPGPDVNAGRDAAGFQPSAAVNPGYQALRPQPLHQDRSYSSQQQATSPFDGRIWNGDLPLSPNGADERQWLPEVPSNFLSAQDAATAENAIEEETSHGFAAAAAQMLNRLPIADYYGDYGDFKPTLQNQRFADIKKAEKLIVKKPVKPFEAVPAVPGRPVIPEAEFLAVAAATRQRWPQFLRRPDDELVYL